LERWISRDEEEEKSAPLPLWNPPTLPATPNGSVDYSVLKGLRELQEEGEPDILEELAESFWKTLRASLKR
jgi:hypothetical protein